MTQPQQGDVHLFNTPDGGDINVELGVVEMGGGLETAVYLSLFGGNEEDSTREGDDRTYWGNRMETETQFRLRSQTQYELARLPAVPYNLRRIEDAARRDLAWMLDAEAATAIEITASIPALNRVKLVITIEASGETSEIAFTENWQAAA